VVQVAGLGTHGILLQQGYQLDDQDQWQHQLNLSHLPSGLYLVVITFQNQSKQLKLMKN
jgi:hypothetical protein